jgi:hypothetical protein
MLMHDGHVFDGRYVMALAAVGRSEMGDTPHILPNVIMILQLLSKMKNKTNFLKNTEQFQA